MIVGADEKLKEYFKGLSIDEEEYLYNDTKKLLLNIRDKNERKR